ncbi:hypothetical protein N3Z17_07135 (plasmid) [Candidatus Bandiella numerosa]|nr:hypothetical protein [Candidatus Bandiella numerosa]WHA05735.1 hypothetical protein N3Z17_07135 [Candidatus Bandiella numerosa]
MRGLYCIFLNKKDELNYQWLCLNKDVKGNPEYRTNTIKEILYLTI